VQIQKALLGQILGIFDRACPADEEIIHFRLILLDDKPERAVITFGGFFNKDIIFQ
jgi:hypothetical protein